MVSECTQLFCMFLLPRGEFQIPNMKPIYMNDLWMFLEVLGGSRKKENLKMNLSEKTNLFGNGNKTLLLDVSGLGFLLTDCRFRNSTVGISWISWIGQPSTCRCGMSLNHGMGSSGGMNLWLKKSALGDFQTGTVDGRNPAKRFYL